MSIQYRVATQTDIEPIAQIRADEWGGVDFWTSRITAYVELTHHPQQALHPRIIFVAVDGRQVIGFIAGHLSTRLNCNAELQWINVAEEYRSTGVASSLLKVLSQWFVEQKVPKVCVNADAENATAHRFYQRYGAKVISPHWLMWTNIGVVLK